MRRFWTELAAIAVLGVALGLGVVWLEDAFAIPKNIIEIFWIALMVVALGFAGRAAWGYYRAIRDEDEWE